MNKKKGVFLSKERELKRKKIIRDMLLAISFSEKKKKNTIKKKKRPVPSQDNLQSHDNNYIDDNPFSLSKEEKEALDCMVKQIQSFDDDEMHEVTYDKMAGLYVENDVDFLGFDADFDPVMLWKDTNLDDYEDLFSKSELNMLKEKQRQIINGGNDRVIVSEDDFEEDIVSEDDYTDDIVSEDDFE